VSVTPNSAGRSGAPVITKGLGKHYGDAPALLPLDLSVVSGERIALIGHNGSGKTTLLRILAGLLDATEGSAAIGGHLPGSIEARTAVSYLADQPVFYDDLSVREHLEYVARLHGNDDWAPIAEALAAQVGLSDRLDSLPSTFSRGLRQKASICLAFVRPFRVLLVDEPFVGLDAAGRQALLAMLDGAHAGGATVIVATHELTTVAASTRVVALREGSLIYDGPSDVDTTPLVEG